MKKIYSFVLVAVAILSATSCQKELVNENLNNATDKFTVTAIASADTKTVLEGNVSYWTPGDKITVFNASGQPVTFSTAITEKAASALFTNSVTLVLTVLVHFILRISLFQPSLAYLMVTDTRLQA